MVGAGRVVSAQAETREEQVGGFTVRVTPHGARAGARLLAKVGRAIGPALSKVVSGTQISKVRTGQEISVDDVELGDLDGAIEALFAQLTDDAVDALIVEILKCSSIVMPDDSGSDRLFDLSKTTEIDRAFTGRLPLMFAVMRFALEVNFGPFFGASGGLAAFVRAAALAPSRSTSPANSSPSGTATS